MSLGNPLSSCDDVDKHHNTHMCVCVFVNVKLYDIIFVLKVKECGVIENNSNYVSKL